MFLCVKLKIRLSGEKQDDTGKKNAGSDPPSVNSARKGLKQNKFVGNKLKQAEEIKRKAAEEKKSADE
jgi:hypothetical protein